MNARSAFESLAIACFAGACGFFLCYFWLQARDAQQANIGLAENIAAIQSAAPEIAKAAAQLQRTASAYGGLTRDYAEIKPTLKALADCRVPVEFERLLIAQDAEINATGGGDKAGADNVRSDGGN